MISKDEMARITDMVSNDSGSMAQMAEAYNLIATEMAVYIIKKFETRNVAKRRLAELIATYTVYEEERVGVNQKHEVAEVADSGEEASEIDTLTPASNKRGRGGRFKGYCIHPEGDRNPRRPGSLGFKSLEIIHQNPGLSYDAFLQAGGRSKDLIWDVTHNNVTIKPVA